METGCFSDVVFLFFRAHGEESKNSVMPTYSSVYRSPLGFRFYAVFTFIYHENA
jgi:hypothetical protein